MARVGENLKVERTAETITVHGATLKTWNVMANGTGFDLHFTVPLTEVENLVDLTPFLQRLCEIQVTRFSRGLRRDVVEEDDVNWLGVDDA